MNTNMEIDPLNPYGYQPYSYEHISTHYAYNVKVEPYHTNNVHNMPQTFGNMPYPYQENVNRIVPPNEPKVTPPENTVKEKTIAPEKEDSKEDLKLLLGKGKKVKTKGKVSSYWNKKIEDKDFPFYGCTICNISFKSIPELDTHVTIHEGRLTSYELRLKNQVKRATRKKEQKKQKKLGKLDKVKSENMDVDVEIKPEDGYIGTEKASDFNENGTENGVSENSENTNSQNKSSKETVDENKELKNGEEADPRLHKLFKCFACQKQFALSYYLKLHVRSHTDERPYTCAECGMSFITASKLGRHNKRIHLSVRYTCRICYRCFSRFEYLTRHFDKKHADDKLEGEPYDYNVILPYLKELEEELKEKNKAATPKPDPWAGWPNADEAQPKIECEDNKAFLYPSIDIVVDGVKCDFNETPIKQEPEEVKEEPDQEPGVDTHDDTHDDTQDDFQNDDCKPENQSDEDYFPENTWAGVPGEAPVCKFPRQCDHCKKVIKSQYYMKVHLRTHTGERPFPCQYCDKSFITSGKLQRHHLTHDQFREKPENQIKVEDDIKTDEGELEKEPAKKKKTRRTKASKDRVVRSVEGFKIRNSFQKRPFACMYCHQRFLHMDTMMEHRKTHKGEDLKCYFCLEAMPDEPSLTAHEETHTGPKPYLCNLCGRSYRKKDAMAHHRKSHDANKEVKEKKEFICDVCNKSYNAACKLQRHLLSHRPDRYVLRYECPVCAHMFNTKYHVRMHLASHQKEGLILEENRNEILAMVLQNARKIPTSTSSEASALADLMPPDERSRVCNICGQVFQHFYYLEEHLKSHGSKIAIEDDNEEENKKHICPVCNKGFKLHYYLKLHSFTHTKEKPFICQQCGKGFITKGKLKRHLETHTGLKKYQCHICYKFFTRPSYLRIHVRTIHGTQDYNFRLDKYELPLSQHSG